MTTPEQTAIPGVARMVRTCDAAPTQYDIFLEDGRYVYFRHRSGLWSLTLYASQEAAALGAELAEIEVEHFDEEGRGLWMSHEHVMAIVEAELPALLALPSSFPARPEEG